MTFDLCIICMLDSKHDARALNLARTLIKNGLKVAIISLGNKQTQLELDKFNITYFQVNIANNKPVWKLWYEFHKYIINNFSNINSRIFLAGDVYSLTSAAVLSKKSRLIYDSREIYSALGSLEQKPFKQYVIAQIEKYYINKVESIIVTGNLDEEYLKLHLRNDCDYHLIMNLPEFKEKLDSNKIRQKFNINKDIKIALYQGMLLKGRGLIPLIHAISEMKNLCLCIMGSGVFEKELKDNIQKLGIEDKIFFTGNIPYNELHEWSCSADIGLCLFEPLTLSYKLALPNKLFEYAMANIPVVATDLPAIKNVLLEYEFGKIVNESLNPKEIAYKINDVLEPSNYNNYIENSKRASKHYCYSTQEELILRIFK